MIFQGSQNDLDVKSFGFDFETKTVVKIISLVDISFENHFRVTYTFFYTKPSNKNMCGTPTRTDFSEEFDFGGLLRIGGFVVLE